MDQYSTEAQEEKLAELRANQRRERIARISRIGCGVLAGAAIAAMIYYRTTIGEWSYQLVGKPATAEASVQAGRPDVKQQLRDIKAKTDQRDKVLDDLMK